jgi:acetolactate synthase-1/2/3 large subunit
MNKISDIIAKFLKKKKILNVFAITGGASIHLIHSISKTNNMRCIFNHHEQSSAMGADAVSRIKGSPSCAVATSGPGATNLITGIACAWFDSIPVIYLTGQVTTFRLKKNLNIRQLGFQETDIINIVRPITKYAVQIKNPYLVLYELEKAFYISQDGRQGPVLIDIPDDIQRMKVKESKLLKFYKPPKKKIRIKNTLQLFKLLQKSKRPTLIFGGGINRYFNNQNINKLINFLNIPFLTTWGAKSLLNEHKLNYGTFGTHGSRNGNFCVQNSDLLIIIGSRLSTRETGSPIKYFARSAKIVLIDIDINEILKFKKLKKKIHDYYNCDSLEFIKKFLSENRNKKIFYKKEWINQNLKWKKIFKRKYNNFNSIDPYFFINKLKEFSPKESNFFVDTGSCLAWIMQDFKCSKYQKIFHDLNFTAMGWALPASIGASVEKFKNIVCIAGDGSFMVNIQELSLVKKYCKNLKIIIINNKGYAMVQQTEGEWLENKHFGTSCKDLSFPDFKYISLANQINYTSIKNSIDLDKLNKFFKSSKNEICEIFISPQKQVIPQVKFGRPIEDAHPTLGEKFLKENMIIKLLK